MFLKQEKPEMGDFEVKKMLVLKEQAQNVGDGSEMDCKFQWLTVDVKSWERFSKIRQPVFEEIKT